MNLVSPGGIFFLKMVGVYIPKCLKEFIGIEEIPGPDAPTNDRNKGKQVDNKYRAVTRSGRVVKVVNKDNF